MTKDMSGAVARTVDQAAHSVHNAINTASDAARPVVDHFAEGAHQAVDRLAGVATHAADTLDARGGQLRDAQLRLTENVRDHVRDKPLTSLGLAVSAGFLLSWLLRLR